MGKHHATDDYEWLFGDHDWDVRKLPNGLNFLVYALYSKKESAGIVALILVSCVSLVAVLGLIVSIIMATVRGRGIVGDHLFVRTQVSTFFTMLLFANLFQAITGIMNAKWVIEKGVYFGDFCRAQGAMKMVSDVSVAVWTLFTAAHTFNLVFLKMEMHKIVLYLTVILGWGIIAAFTIGGPASVDRVKRGPFFGISGLWCWVAEGYPVHRITNDYLVMFLSGVFTTVFYVLIWLRTRGNIVRVDGRLRFQKNPPPPNWRQSDLETTNTKLAAGRLLLFPIFNFITLLPIAIVRFSTMNGHRASLEATISADAIYMLSGVFNVLLFFITRRVLPARGLVRWKTGDSRSSGINVQLPGSPDSTEKGTLPGDLGIYLVEEPAMMKTAAWDDNFAIDAQPPTPGVPRSPYALPSARPGVASGFEQAQTEALNEKAPFTPRPFRLSMNAPSSPMAPCSPIGDEPRQPFTPRALRLSQGATTPGPPHSPPGLDNPPVSPMGQEVSREPAPLKSFHLSSAPLGRNLSKKTVGRRGGSLGYVSADEVQAKRGHISSFSVPEASIAGSVSQSVAAPQPVPINAPQLPLSLVAGGMPQSAFVAEEDETTRERGRPGFDHHDSGAWSPSREAHSRAPSIVPSRMPSRVPSRAPSPAGSIGIASASSASTDSRSPMSDRIVMMGPLSGIGPLSAYSRAGEDSDYDEPEFEMMH